MTEEPSAKDLIEAMDRFLKGYGNSDVLERLEAIEADIKDIKENLALKPKSPFNHVKPPPPNVNLLNDISPELQAYVDGVQDLDREVRIYLKWMPSELFTELSGILQSRSYIWVSQGKDSHWMREK